MYLGSRFWKTLFTSCAVRFGMMVKVKVFSMFVFTSRAVKVGLILTGWQTWQVLRRKEQQEALFYYYYFVLNQHAV